MAKYEHLPLQRIEGELERRKHSAPVPSPKRIQGDHGPKVEGQIEAALDFNKSLPSIAGYDPAFILKVRTEGIVQEDTWKNLGLYILAKEPEKTLVLFANDKELTEFRRKVSAYQDAIPEGQKNPQFAGFVEAIAEVGNLGPLDRIGPALKDGGYDEPLKFLDAEEFVLDIELWKPDDPGQARIFVYRVEGKLKQRNGELVSEYRGNAALLVRVRGTGQVIRELLELPEVAKIDLPPKPDLPSVDFDAVTLDDLPEMEGPDFAAPVIGIIDSGVSSAHPLLINSVVGTFGQPTTLGDDDEKGHGTPVSGIAVFGDVRERIASGNLKAQFRLASAKVVNAKGEFDERSLVPEQMESAIRQLNEEYGCRVINMSLGDIRHPVSQKPSAWAAVLDDLARELDILIVISAGNADRLAILRKYGDGVVDAFPDFLLDEDNRVLEPASAVNALTVGSIAHTNGLNEEDGDFVGIRPITVDGQPSPFTRTGPGVEKTIKPDLSDYGGTAVFDGTVQKLLDGQARPTAGVLTLHHRYTERLLTSRSGTSFASPLVSYKAGMLFENFPEASANLIRSLLALSAEVPKSASNCLGNLKKDAPYRLLGYGVANVEYALASDDNRVILFGEDELGVDKFAVYEIPIPELYQTEKGNRHIRVSLAYDPPVRHTRLDYAGISMNFRLLRGVSQQEVFDNFRKWEKDKEGAPYKVAKRFECETRPGPKMREHGTLQCATFSASRTLKKYGDRYFLVVRCQGGWAAPQIDSQRFAVSVEVRHEAEIELYAQLQQQIRLRAEVKV